MTIWPGYMTKNGNMTNNGNIARVNDDLARIWQQDGTEDGQQDGHLPNGSRGAEIQLGNSGRNLQMVKEVLLLHAQEANEINR